MLRIAACDDDEKERLRIAELLGRYREEKNAPLRFDVYRSGVELLEAREQIPYDLLLLDILMPGLNGMDAAKEIRLTDGETKLIFLTSSPEFAVESYSVEAYSYLLKPVTAEKLFPLLDRFFSEQRQSEQVLTLMRPAGVMRIPFSKLSVLEVSNKKLRFHLQDGSVKEVNGALSELEETLLSREEFVKVHRSYLVNMSQIQSLSAGELTTYAGQRVPVSRLLQTQVRDRYMNYLFAEKEETP